MLHIGNDYMVVGLSALPSDATYLYRRRKYKPYDRFLFLHRSISKCSILLEKVSLGQLQLVPMSLKIRKMFFSTVNKALASSGNMFFCNRSLLSLSNGSNRGFLASHILVQLKSPTLKYKSNVLQGSFMPSSPVGKEFWRIRVASFRQATFGRRANDTWSRYNQHYGRNKFNKLKKPALFAAAFCVGTTIIVPYLYDYSPLAYFKRRPQLLVYSIIAINGVGFLMWKSPQFTRYMMRYGLLVRDNMATPWSMLGSAFSHQSFGHFLVNMFVLSSFGTTLCSIVGVSNFTIMYLNSAVISSLFSLSIPALLSSTLATASLGASGAVFAVVGAFSYLIPKASVAFFFVPIPGGAWLVFLGSVAYNIAGVVLRLGRYDYAAHIGGSVAGIAYGWWFDQKRKEFLKRKSSSYF